MNPLILLAQAFLNHQTQLLGDNLRQAGHRAAQAGRRMALASGLFAISGLFTFSALILAVIETGRQIEASEALRLSGLMISALMLLGLSLSFMLVGWWIGRDGSSKDDRSSAHRGHDSSHPQASDLQIELRTLLESLAVSLLREFMAAREKKAKESAAHSSATPSEP